MHLRYFLPALFALALQGVSTPLWADTESIESAHVPDQCSLLQEAISHYRLIASRGGWGEVPPGKSLRVGDENERVSILRRRLLISEDLKVQEERTSLFSEALQAAVINFQTRHGLERDGIVGVKTVRELNIPISGRIGSLEINLERSKRLHKDLSNYFIIVNIAGFELIVLKNREVKFRSPVVVGKAYQKTPVLSSAVEYVEFNPYWNVPSSIAKKEMLPALRKDENYLAKNHLRLFSGSSRTSYEVDPTGINWHAVSPAQIAGYRIRQDIGPWNALGSVKFGFPNADGVYLHDTPSKNLFLVPTRTFSHGCIRVANALVLAELLLKEDGQDFNAAAIEKLVNLGGNKLVNLKNHIPIHIIYRTAWVDLDGSVQFRPDIYSRDSDTPIF